MNANGEVYIVGDFRGTVDFDPGLGSHQLSSLGATFDIFLMKLSASGTLLWVNVFGNNSNERGKSLAIDSNGDVIIVGTFEGAVNFNPGPGVNFLFVQGSRDVFVCKYGSSGNLIFALVLEVQTKMMFIMFR